MLYKFKLKPGQGNPSGIEIKHHDGWNIVETDDVGSLPANIEFFQMDESSTAEFLAVQDYEATKDARADDLYTRIGALADPVLRGILEDLAELSYGGIKGPLEAVRKKAKLRG